MNRIRDLATAKARIRGLEDQVKVDARIIESQRKTIEIIGEELGATIEDRDRLRKALEAYRAKMAVDGYNGRVWNAMKHWDAEQAVIEAEKNLADDT